jgi:hypothetical protein
MAINSQGWAQLGMTALSAYTGVPLSAGASRGGGGSLFGAPSESTSSGFSGGIGSGLDGSGWAINFRGTQTATSSPTRVTDYSNGDARMPQGQQQPVVMREPDAHGLPFMASGQTSGPALAGGNNMLLWVALGGLALVAVWRLKKSK